MAIIVTVVKAVANSGYRSESAQKHFFYDYLPANRAKLSRHKTDVIVVAVQNQYVEKVRYVSDAKRQIQRSG